MSRRCRLLMVVVGVAAAGWNLGCSTNRDATQTAAQAHAPAPSPALLFGDRAELTSATRMIRRPTGSGGQQWEVTRTYNSGRTRISAVRRPGNNVTEYYTSSTGPEGSTARRRVVAKSSNTDR